MADGLTRDNRARGLVPQQLTARCRTEAAVRKSLRLRERQQLPRHAVT
jgi:hypothetical protein